MKLTLTICIIALSLGLATAAPSAQETESALLTNFTTQAEKLREEVYTSLELVLDHFSEPYDALVAQLEQVKQTFTNSGSTQELQENYNNLLNQWLQLYQQFQSQYGTILKKYDISIEQLLEELWISAKNDKNLSSKASLIKTKGQSIVQEVNNKIANSDPLRKYYNLLSGILAVAKF